MGSQQSLIELVEHNHWANQVLISFCSQLPREQIEFALDGVYGSPLETLQHIISAEGSYTRRFTGKWPDHPWKDDADVELAVLAERATTIRDALVEYLATDWDSEGITQTRGDGYRFDVRDSVLINQLIHHGNEHRAHVGTSLGAQGLEVPEVSVWEFALATGRMWITGPDEG